MKRAETSTLTLGTTLPKGCLEEIVVLAILLFATHWWCAKRVNKNKERMAIKFAQLYEEATTQNSIKKISHDLCVSNGTQIIKKLYKISSYYYKPKSLYLI